MARSRAIILGLDGFELSFAERLLAAGRLPNLRRMRETGASLLLDHGKAKRTGLAWEHVSTGLSPEDANRWAAVDFDPTTYRVSQRHTKLKPFPALLGCRTVVFDAPYFDLAQAPEVCGIVSWGAHDPGISTLSQPAGLRREIRSRFGPYPATEFIYGFVWPDSERACDAAQDLVRAVDTRSDITAWLLGERLPDWDLAYVVISEYHSAAESLWHGVDPNHPLATLPSAATARVGLEGVYEAADRMLGRMLERFPDANIVAFNLHGMGPNDSDVASMALLPELMYRYNFSRARLRSGPWPTLDTGVPLIASKRRWNEEVQNIIGNRALHHRIASRIRNRLIDQPPKQDNSDGSSLNWMPSTRYQPDWPFMRAFALPAYYDGRVRINLKGRESHGKVALSAYDKTCDKIETLLGECRNILTGEPVVREIDRIVRPGATHGESEADIVIVWNGAPLGLSHPKLGKIGPLPYHRTGGHSGHSGVAYFYGPNIATGWYSTRSAFDVVPTMIDLLKQPQIAGMSGSVLRDVIKSDAAGHDEWVP